MVDFNKLKITKNKKTVIDPIDIFRRLPKPQGINDPSSSQAEVLHQWFLRREERDIVLKLHTGGGKTLVGLLLAQSTLNETKKPVLYLASTRQLVTQTLEKAASYGISAVSYESGKALSPDFINGNAIMVSTYSALFNGKSKFGIRGLSQPQVVSAIVLDDAHTAFSIVRDAFTLDIKSDENPTQYKELANIFRKSFKDSDKLGTFDDTVSGLEYGVLEVPYWAWHEQLDSVREQIKSDAEKYAMVWPLLRDQLHLCHALISSGAFTITPILPLIDLFPTFVEAPRRIYMSATIADDSEIIRTFNASAESVETALTSRSLAGISERMILIPDLMSFDFNVKKDVEYLMTWASSLNLGAIILTSSTKSAEQWASIATVAKTPLEVEQLVKQLQNGHTFGPVAFANRYDGIDLPGDSCRLLVMNNLPSGTSNYELFRAASLYGGTTITRMLAQRIEQGIGRGSRGSGDHCVVLLTGSDIAGWVSKDLNYRFLTSATRAQLEMGNEVSKEIHSLKDLIHTIQRSFDRDKDWTEYHAETLAELVDEDITDQVRIRMASVERKAIALWQDSYDEKAIATIDKLLSSENTIDQPTKGWIRQLSARIADKWGNRDLSENLQRQAYAHNRSLLRPKVVPPYRPLAIPAEQAQSIVQKIGGYRLRSGYLKQFEEVVSFLNENSSANQFEKSLADFGSIIGFSSERYDNNGEGPDVLWLLPSKVGIVIEAKSRKKIQNPLNKAEHGQLLVAEEWFKKNYSDYECVRASIHPDNIATKAAVAGASHALTYKKIALLISDARILITQLCDSQLPTVELEAYCNTILNESNLDSNRILKYFQPFREQA